MTSSIDSNSPASVPPPPAPGAAAPKPSTFDRLIGVLMAPAETFAEIAQRPNWVGPLSIIVVLAIAGAVILGTRIDWHSVAQEAIEANPNIPPDRAAGAVSVTTAIMKVTNYATPLLAAVIILIVAAVLLVSFKLFAGEINFNQAFSVTLYAWMPRVIKGLIALAILAARGSVDMYTLQNPVASNLGFLVDPKSNLLLYTMLSSIDLFNIWSIVLLTIGFAVASKLSRGRSAAIVIGWWIVVNLFSLIGPAMQMMKR